MLYVATIPVQLAFYPFYFGEGMFKVELNDRDITSYFTWFFVKNAEFWFYLYNLVTGTAFPGTLPFDFWSWTEDNVSRQNMFTYWSTIGLWISIAIMISFIFLLIDLVFLLITFIIINDYNDIGEYL